MLREHIYILQYLLICMTIPLHQKFKKWGDSTQASFLSGIKISSSFLTTRGNLTLQEHPELKYPVQNCLLHCLLHSAYYSICCFTLFYSQKELTWTIVTKWYNITGTVNRQRASEEVEREVSEANALEPEVQVQVTTEFSQLLPTKVWGWHCLCLWTKIK